MKKLLSILVISLLLSGNAFAVKNFDGFLKAINNAKKINITIDFENTAKGFGYKDAEEFFLEYKKKYDLEDLTIEEAKEFLIGTDRSIQINESENNLKILHKLILKDKLIKRQYLNKKKNHAKILAIYFDYEKEMAKISKNPNLEKIGRFAFHWQWHVEEGPDIYYNQESEALEGCEENRLKRGIPDGGECILVEYRYQDQFKILIKPKYIKKAEAINKSKNVPKKNSSEIFFCKKRENFPGVEPVFLSSYDLNKINGCGDNKQVEINQYIDEILNYRMQLASSFWNASFFKLSYAKNIIKEFNELDLDTNYLIKILQNEYGFSIKELDLQDTQLAKSEPNKETEKVKVNKSDDNNSIKVLLCKNFEKQFKYEVFLKEEYNNDCPSRAPIKVNFNEYKDKSLGTFSSNSSKFGLCVRKKLSKKASENTSYTPFLFSRNLPCEDNKKIFSTIDAKFDGTDIYIEKNKYTKHILSFDDGYFEKKVVKKSDDNFLKAIDDAKALPETYLTFEEVDYLSKSITNINFDNMMDLGESNLISFSNELQHLFGKRKKYSNNRIAFNSMEKIAKIYVKDKKFLEKYPYKTILGMAYFEFFYAGEFYKEKEDVQKFKEQFPNVGKKEIQVVKNLYNLNQVREKMRESLGFTLDDKTTDVIKSYISLSKYLENSKPEKVKLNSYQKKQIKLYENFNKELANYEKNIKTKNKNRITDEKFERLLERYYKKILKTNSKIQKLKSKKNQENVENERFKSLFNNITEIISFTDKNLKNNYSDYQLALDSIYFVKDILSLTKAKSTKKKYDQVWDDNLNIEEILSSEEIKYLNLLNQKSKLRKITKDKQFQSVVINLITNNYPVLNLISKVEKQFETKIKPIKINYGSFDEMKNWNKEDWANAWKGSIPLELNDIDGSIINFSDQNVEDLKAQLALNNLKDLVNTDDIGFIQSQSKEIQNSIDDLNNTNISTILNQDFSITLDNYSKILAEDAINRFGDQFDAQTIQEIRDNANFENLTAIMNMEYGTNVTSEEYKSYWQSAQYMNSTSSWEDVTRGVDLISNLSSFDAAAAAKELGADLQTVADSIAQAASVGISTDLEAAAQGAGFDSFSDAVNAYNEQYGTNYTDEEAREALGQ